MENGKKRVRSSNFSEQDKVLLISIISNYKNIIENKCTNLVTTKAKNIAWQKICDTFNAASGRGRSVQSLQIFYKNKKKDVRQKVADEKCSTKKTGGGPSKVFQRDQTEELVHSLMNIKSIYGLPCSHDSDAISSSLEANKNKRLEIADFQKKGLENLNKEHEKRMILLDLKIQNEQKRLKTNANNEQYLDSSDDE
ncbi:unnamed protein product [Psylliodes chrysocephalus]|uniref:Regulatory protein zeste n=1 Tax=Psylliodes chrysocephalus TaxID=3402493 RepID=A0A9P0CUS9_9CUCU|nr:unnamed protein product [Psylliodes chrysocephala]